MKEFNKVACWGENNLHLAWHAINYNEPGNLSYFGNFFDNDEYAFRRKTIEFLETLDNFDLELTDLDFDYNFFKEQDELVGGISLEEVLLKECEGKKCEDNVKKIIKNKFQFSDIKVYLDETKNKSLLYYIGFRFKYKIGEKDFKDKFNAYLDAFIENNIFSEKTNIYTFDIHKEAGFEAIYEIYDKFGSHFIINQQDKKIFLKDEFLFLHFFLALNRLGYLDILDIDLTSNDSSLSLAKNKYKVRINLLDSFFDNTSKKDDKVIGQESESTKYDSGILKIESFTISFIDKPNQKELLDVLFSDPKKQWYFDEIQEKWDEHMTEFPENYWRKFYTAGDGINNNIAKKTTISDFLEKTTKQIWINKKYLANS